MHGNVEIVFSLAGRLHVLLRREINRIVDVEWFCADAVYAGEVIRLVRNAHSDEMNKLADRIEEVHPLLPRVEQRTAPVTMEQEIKYVKTLR
jgi:hypothetical protein